MHNTGGYWRESYCPTQRGIGGSLIVQHREGLEGVLLSNTWRDWRESYCPTQGKISGDHIVWQCELNEVVQLASTKKKEGMRFGWLSQGNTLGCAISQYKGERMWSDWLSTRNEMMWSRVPISANSLTGN